MALSDDLIELCEKSHYVDQNLDISFQADKQRLQNPYTVYHKGKPSQCILFSVLCTGLDKETGERVEIIYDLLNIPDTSDLLMINGGNKQVIEEQRSSSGWYVGVETKANNKIHSIRLKKSGTKRDSSVLTIQEKPDEMDKSSVKQALSMLGHGSYGAVNASFSVSHKVEGERTYKQVMIEANLGVFLVAITGKSYSDLIAEIGNYGSLPSILTRYYQYDMDRESALSQLYNIFVSKANDPNLKQVVLSYDNMYDELFTRSLCSTNRRLDKSAKSRLISNNAFKTRALGMTLAEDVEIISPKGDDFERRILGAETYLDEELLDLIDRNEIDLLKVRYNNKVYYVKKYSEFRFRGLGKIVLENVVDYKTGNVIVPANTVLGVKELDLLDNTDIASIKIKDDKVVRNLTRRTELDNFDVRDLMLCLNTFFNSMDGYPYIDNEYSMENRKFVSINTSVYRSAESWLSEVTTQILDNYKNSGSELKLSTAMQLVETEPNILLEDYNSSVNKFVQTANITNPLAVQMNNVKTDMEGTHFTEDMRNIAPMSQGRIDPIVTPESSKVGIVLYRTLTSNLNPSGEVTTPFIEIENGRPKSDKPVHLSALEERDKYVIPFDESCLTVDADGNEVYKEFVYARRNDKTVKVHPSKVSLQDYSPFQTCCIARALVPFRPCLAAKRQTMASNHQMQCFYTLMNERPIVNTGAESLEPSWKVTAREILEEYYSYNNLAGQGIDKDLFCNSYIKIRNVEDLLGKRKVVFTVVGFSQFLIEKYIMFMEHSDKASIYSTRINNSNPRLEYVGDDIVFYDIFYDIDNHGHQVYGDFGLQEVDPHTFETGLALGVNLTVCYKTFEGSTIDDAIVINQDLVGRGIFTSINLYKVEYHLNNLSSTDREETFGIHPSVDPATLPGITTSGVPEVGTYLRGGDVVIAKYERELKSSNNDKESSVLRETNIRMSAVEEGEVVYAAVENGIATVMIASLASIEAGDKLTGRHGNKGVVGKVVPARLMPFMDDGTPVDIILNPLGVPSRSNISQIFEAVIGMALKRKGKLGIIGGNIKPIDLARQLCEETDVKPMYLRDGRTGQYFKRPMNVGVTYMLRSEHLVSHKVNSLGFPDKVDGITGQPQKGRAVKGGNAIGEMELDIFRATDCNKLHDAIMSYYSSDVNTRAEVKRLIMANPLSLNVTGKNDNNRFMETLFKPMGIKVVTEGDAYVYRILTDNDVRKLAPRPIDLTEPATSLRDPKIFGTIASMKTRMGLRERWGYIDLGCDMVNPFFVVKGVISELLVFSMLKKSDTDEEEFSTGRQVYGPLRLTDYMNLINSEASFNVDESVDADGKPIYSITYYDAPGASVQQRQNSGRKRTSYRRISGEYHGIDAVVKLLRMGNLDTSIRYYEDNVDKYQEDVNKIYYDWNIPFDTPISEAISLVSMEAQKQLRNKQTQLEEGKRKLNYVVAFKESGMKLTDFIFRNYPVLPIIYRPEPVQGRYQDYDEYYKDICTAVTDSKISGSVESRTRIYQNIIHLTGITDVPSAPKGRTPILTKMAGTSRSSSNISADAHGIMRDDLGRRRVTNSGRSVIIPCADITMDMLHVGIPEIMAVDMWNYHLVSYMNAKHNKDSSDGTKLYEITNEEWIRFMVDVVSGKIDDMNYKDEANKDIAAIIKPSTFVKEMYEFIEGDEEKGLSPQIVIFGRQPSFIVNSARAYYVKLVKGKAIHIHPLVCRAYNADFDGDQMWTMAVLDDDCKKEAMDKMSYRGHMLSSKDRSVLVDPQQDVRIGCYMATMLKDNRLDIDDPIYDLSNVNYYDSLEAMGEDVKCGKVETYELACYTHPNGNKYLSTVGRILFNCMLPSGFTDDDYENVLNLPVQSDENPFGINLTGYKQLRYDGLLSKNAGVKKGLKYESLGKAVFDLVDDSNIDEDTKVAIMQKVLQFGLYFSDIYGLSFTLDDLEANPKKALYVEAAKKACAQVDADFKAGLIPEKIRTESIIEINDACVKKFSDVLVDEMRRTNNMFIMLDSGARGNKTQINQAVGIIGILSKSKTEKLDMPIYSNFSEGLSELEQYGSSYAGRMGINSTQNETAETGAMLRKATFLASTVVVREEDCGRDEDAKDMYIKLRYTDLKSVVRVDYDPNVPDYERPRIPTELEEVTKHKLADNGEWFDVHFKNFIKDGYLTGQALELIDKYKLTTIKCEDCMFVLRFKLSDMSKTQLLYRRAFALPFMIDGEYISEETVKYIEDNNLKDIRVRTLFGCKSKNGICAKCYGLLYTSRKLPEVGSNVAMESAQDVGESASQLTLNLVHSLGTKGGELSSGVKFLRSLLDCSTSTFDVKVYNGNGEYVKVSTIGDYSSVKFENKSSVKLSKQKVNVIDGEYVDKYSHISKGLVNPNNIGTGTTVDDIMERQHTMLQLYYDTYAANGINLMARHFEILVKGQGSVAVATEDKDGYKSGFKYNLQELMSNNIGFREVMVSGDEAVRVNGGTMTAMTIGNAPQTMKNAFLSQNKDYNYSSKGKTLIGESLDNPKRVSVSIEADLGDKNLNAFNKFNSPDMPADKVKPNIGSLASRRGRPARPVLTIPQPEATPEPTPIKPMDLGIKHDDIEDVTPTTIEQKPNQIDETVVAEQKEIERAKKMSLI